MRIAVINEVSASEKNKDILAALSELSESQIQNVGMSCPADAPQLTYIHTGLMAAVLLWEKKTDMVIGGCGTGQGFLNAAMQYPGVFCGLIIDPLDAWLFSQINGGNCVSLPLNKGYGWAGDINLKYLIRELFRDEAGRGYPPARSESQAQSRALLKEISGKTHKSMTEIIQALEPSMLRLVAESSAFMDLIKGTPCAEAINARVKEI